MRWGLEQREGLRGGRGLDSWGEGRLARRASRMGLALLGRRKYFVNSCKQMGEGRHSDHHHRPPGSRDGLTRLTLRRNNRVPRPPHHTATTTTGKKKVLPIYKLRRNIDDCGVESALSFLSLRRSRRQGRAGDQLHASQKAAGRIRAATSLGDLRRGVPPSTRLPRPKNTTVTSPTTTTTTTTSITERNLAIHLSIYMSIRTCSSSHHP